MINRLYVIRCQTPNKWYVGITTRLPWERLAEHLNGDGSRWTREHGVSCMVFSVIVANALANRLESQMTAYLMARFGWANPRRGPHVLWQRSNLPLLVARRVPQGIISRHTETA